MVITFRHAVLIYLMDFAFSKLIVFGLIFQPHNKSGIMPLDYSDVQLYGSTCIVVSIMMSLMATEAVYTGRYSSYLIIMSTLMQGSLIYLSRIAIPYEFAKLSFGRYVKQAYFRLITLYYGTYVLLSCMKTRLNKESRPTRIVVDAAALVFFAHLSTPDSNLPALGLIRFLAITALHFPRFFAEINSENFIKKCWKVSKFFVAFCLCHTAPKLNLLVNGDKNWQDIVWDPKYFIVAKAILMFLIIKFPTDFLSRKINFWLRSNTNYNFIPSLLCNNWTSPIFFLLLGIDKQIWNTSGSRMVVNNTIHIYLVIHALVILSNVSDTISASLVRNRQANEMGARAIKCTAFTFISTICFLGASLWTFAFNSHLLIIIFFSVYVFATSVTNALTYYFFHCNADPNSVQGQLQHLDDVKSIMRGCLLLLLSVSLLWIYKFVESGIMVFLGAVWYASELRGERTINWLELIRFLRVKYLFYFTYNISTEQLQLLDDVCLICHEEMTPGCVITVCGHYYHEPCLSAWLHRSGSQKCPMCQCALFHWFRIV